MKSLFTIIIFICLSTSILISQEPHLKVDGKLHLYTNPSTPQLRLEGTQSYMELWGGLDFLVRNSSDINLIKVQGATGNVGIGIGLGIPQRKLHLKTQNTPQIRLEDSRGYVELWGGQDFVVNNSAGGLRFMVTSAGPLFALLSNIGDWRNMQYNHQTGEIGYDNSSRRDKENIRDLDEDFEALLKVKPKKYTRINIPHRYEIGFLAEDFQDLGLLPLVEYDMEGHPDGIRYDKIVTYIIPLLKKYSADLDAKEIRMQGLEFEMKILQERLDALEKMYLSKKTSIKNKN